MGLHLPGAAFVHPHDDLRQALNVAAGQQAVAISRKSADYRPLGALLDERSFVNAIVGLHATGGSTNHTLHLPAMAAAAGIQLEWQDFADLSEIVPLLARVYPNGAADEPVSCGWRDGLCDSGIAAGRFAGWQRGNCLGGSWLIMRLSQSCGRLIWTGRRLRKNHWMIRFCAPPLTRIPAAAG